MRDVVLCGDVREALAGLPDASVDAVVTDPPYALTQVSRGGSVRQNDPTKADGRHRLADKGFMGQQWDNGLVAHDPAFWAEVLRVAKPGAFLLAFGGTRTYHRLACAIEDAGWQCRDMVMWLYGSGFPKSKSCLKPAHEPIVLAKAPGALQPLQSDACRVRLQGDEDLAAVKRGNIYGAHGIYGACENKTPPALYKAAGRWPPNLVLSHVPPRPDGTGGCQPAGVRRVPASRGGEGGRRGSDTCYAQDAYTQTYQRTERPTYADADGYEQVEAWSCVPQCPIRLLDEQAGPRASGGTPFRRAGMGYGGADGQDVVNGTHGDTGSASRFFPTFAGEPEPEDAQWVPFRYEPKASRRDRGEGNTHCTVKPTALMAWLARLLCRPGDTILDPFCGSGSTLVACVREGMHFIGIDMSEQYCAIARRRIAHEQERQSGPLFAGVAACD